MAKKKKVVKKAVKRSSSKSVKHEIVVRVQPQEILPVPTASELAEPIHEGKQLSITKTWVSDKQIMRMVQKTPATHIYKRKGKGGQIWDYVTGAYVEKVLNFVFGFLWDFEVVEHGVMGDFVWVKGRLTVKDGKGGAITKMQFGRAEIKYKKDTAHKPENMLDFGNDLKSASTDALKKCASLLGIASDIYGKTEYKQETDRDVAPEKEQATPQSRGVAALPPSSETEYHCKGVNGKGCSYGTVNISKQENDYSMKMFKKPLCRECQKDAKK